MVLNSCASVLTIARDKSFTYRLRFRSLSTFDVILYHHQAFLCLVCCQDWRDSSLTQVSSCQLGRIS